MIAVVRARMKRLEFITGLWVFVNLLLFLRGMRFLQ